MTETRWLDEQEMLIWRAFLYCSSGVLRHLGTSIKAASGLTLDDYEVLVHLSEADDRRMRMTELSERLLNSQSRLTQRIDRLVERGLVRREKCPEDRRGMFACLSDQGMRTIEGLAPIHLDDVRHWLIDLIEPGEREVVAAVLERVAEVARQKPDLIEATSQISGSEST